jgi:hypothetical protein
MKNHLYLSLAIISFLFLSCSKESKIKNEINEYVEKNFNAPESYELVELKLFDTINEQKVSKYLTNQRLDKLKRIKQYVKEKREEQSKIASQALFSGNRFYLMSAMSKLDKQDAILKSFEKDSIQFVQIEVDKLKKYSLSKKIIYYRYVHEYRAKNDVGALVKCIDTLRVKDDLTLILDFQGFLIKKFGMGIYKNN